jgi:hypothetical protein
MTNIYIYCLFDGTGQFMGVYSSIKAAHRDAMKLANNGNNRVYLQTEDGLKEPDLALLRNIFKGKCDLIVKYRGGKTTSKILKTRLKE